jgi:ribose-phosphate pyrophosphokinase
MQPTTQSIALFSPAASAALGGAIAKLLAIPLSPIEESEFGGGERKLRPLEDVHGRAVYVIHSLFGDSLGSANDHLCEMLFLIGALKDAGARRVTACAPYLAYARQDRRIESGDPVTTRYVAQLFEAVGVERVVCLEVHDPAAFENAFRCGTVHVGAGSSFVQHFAAKPSGLEYAVVSPDIGGAKRARHFQGLLQTALGRPVDYALMDKTRSRGGVSGTLFAGDVAGKHVIILDDLISSGTTVLRAVGACRRAGATRVDVAATHASFAPEARRLFDPDIPAHARPDSVVVTDSVPLGADFSSYATGPLTVLGIAPVLARAIGSLEAGCS